MEVVFYSTHCPKCNVLQKKLNDKGIEYKEVTDVKAMLKRGFAEAPKLEVDGELMDFSTAITWVNSKE